MVDDRGARVGPTTGAPTLAFSAVPERFDPSNTRAGRLAPTARSPCPDGGEGRRAGSETGSGCREPRGSGSYEVVGLTTFGGAGSVGGAAFTVLTLPEVQALAGEPGRISEIDVQAGRASRSQSSSGA